VLDTAIGSLRGLGSLYKQREMRWIEEKQRFDEDNETIRLLLKQVLDVGVVGNCFGPPRRTVIDNYYSNSKMLLKKQHDTQRTRPTVLSMEKVKSTRQVKRG
jgi:hypothetical protein